MSRERKVWIKFAARLTPLDEEARGFLEAVVAYPQYELATVSEVDLLTGIAEEAPTWAGLTLEEAKLLTGLRNRWRTLLEDELV